MKVDKDKNMSQDIMRKQYVNVKGDEDENVSQDMNERKMEEKEFIYFI